MPYYQAFYPGPLHIWMSTENTEGYIHCEKLALLDLSIRGYKKTDSLPISEMMNVSDAIQGILNIFDDVIVFTIGLGLSIIKQ